MNKEQEYWYNLGYTEQIWGYPLKDHVWGSKKYIWSKSKHPKKYQQYYKEGQLKAFTDGKAIEPSWHSHYKKPHNE